jgi:hypothetical protein
MSMKCEGCENSVPPLDTYCAACRFRKRNEGGMTKCATGCGVEVHLNRYCYRCRNNLLARETEHQKSRDAKELKVAYKHAFFSTPTGLLPKPSDKVVLGPHDVLSIQKNNTDAVGIYGAEARIIAKAEHQIAKEKAKNADLRLAITELKDYAEVKRTKAAHTIRTHKMYPDRGFREEVEKRRDEMDAMVEHCLAALEDNE